MLHIKWLEKISHIKLITINIEIIVQYFQMDNNCGSTQLNKINQWYIINHENHSAFF